MKLHYALLLTIAVLTGNHSSLAQSCSIDYEGASLVEKDEQREVYATPDGVTITRYSDREEALCPDGTRITRYADGGRLVEKPGGERILYRKDGTVRYTGNGVEREASLQGRTPYGLEIKEESRTLRRRDFTVELIYSSSLSDDAMDGNMKSLFAELAKEIDRYLNSITPGRGSVRIMMSNCRFCVSGYCGGKKTMGLEVIALGHDGTEKKIFFERGEIINKTRHHDIALRAVEHLLKK